MKRMALMALVLTLGATLILTDFKDLRFEIPPEVELEPFDFAAIQAGKIEDAERQLRNSDPAFADGHWKVEASIDHAAHWNRQLELLDAELVVSKSPGCKCSAKTGYATVNLIDCHVSRDSTGAKECR